MLYYKAAWGASTQPVHPSELWLHYFQTNSLLMSLGQQLLMTKYLGLCHLGGSMLS